MIDKSRKEKIEALVSIMSGNCSGMKPLIDFIELRTNKYSPGVYVDRSGKEYSEEEKDQLIKAAQGKCEIPWVEIRTY